MKIVIVEDEIKSLMGLQKLVGELGEEWEIVGTATNGKKGIEIIENEKPDIIITDVMMPLMDGLEMIKEINKKGIICKFIVLSGYADFQFAQKTLQLGGIDYLLKPITKKSIKKILEKVKKIVLEESRKINPSLFSTSELLNRISFIPGEDIKEYYEEIRSRFSQDNSNWIFLFKGNNSYARSEREKMRDIIKYYFSPFRYEIFGEERKEEIFVFAQGTEKELLIRVNEMKISVEKIVGIPIVFCYVQLSMWEKLYASIRMVEDNCNWNLSLEKSAIISDFLIESIQCNKFVYPENIERSIVKKINTGNIKEIEEEIQKFISFLTANSYYYGDIREAMLCLTVSILYEIRKASYGIYEEISHLNVLEWVKTRLFTNAYIMVMMNLIRKFENYKKNIYHCESPIINKVLHIIKTEYRGNISVDEMARMLSITPDYLSTLFIKEVGIRYTVYYTQVKVEQAKLFLREGKWKIYEVAEKSGYSDVKYFCKVFKKYTGKSPSEYIRF